MRDEAKVRAKAKKTSGEATVQHDLPRTPTLEVTIAKEDNSFVGSFYGNLRNALKAVRASPVDD